MWIFSLKTLFEGGAVAAVLQGMLAFLHLLHFVGNLIIASNLQAILGFAGVLVGLADILSPIVSGLNTLWLTIGWLAEAGTIMQAFAAPSSLVVSIGASAAIEGLYVVESVVQGAMDLDKLQQANFDNMTPAAQYASCTSTLGEANC